MHLSSSWAIPNLVVHNIEFIYLKPQGIHWLVTFWRNLDYIYFALTINAIFSSLIQLQMIILSNSTIFIFFQLF